MNFDRFDDALTRLFEARPEMRPPRLELDRDNWKIGGFAENRGTVELAVLAHVSKTLGIVPGAFALTPEALASGKSILECVVEGLLKESVIERPNSESCLLESTS